MDLHELVGKLELSSVEPVYIVHGPERYFVDRLIEKLRTFIAGAPMADLNFIRLKARELSGAAIAATAAELPMMAPMRIIVVEDSQKLTVKDWEGLEGYLSNPSPSTALVFVADKLDMRKGAIQKANKRKTVHKAEPLKEKQISGFVRQLAKEKKVRLGSDAVAAVVVAVGSDCGALADAVERLGLFVGPGKEAGEADVAQVVSSVRSHSVFELVDSIGNRQLDYAMALLSGLLSRREEPIMINAMIARHFRQLLLARIHQHLRTEKHQLASAIGTPPFMVEKLMGQSRRFRGAILEGAIAKLAEADQKLKSSRQPGSRIVEQAVMELCLAK